MKLPSLSRCLYLIYFLLLGGPLFVLATILCCLVVIVASYLGLPASFISRATGLWSKVCLAVSLVRVEVRGREHLPQADAPCVVVANHQSSFDIFVLNGHIGIPFKWVLKQELRKMPLVGKACEAAGFVFVDETRPSSIVHTITDAKAVLATGDSIFIFPEGSRTLTGRMARFKKGGFVIASELDAPILPVSIDGAYDVLRRGSYLPHCGKIVMTIHPAFQMSELASAPAHIPASARHAQQVIASAITSEATEAKGR